MKIQNKRKEEHLHCTTLKERKSSLLADLLAFQVSAGLYIGKKSFQKMRRVERVARQDGHTRDLSLWFWRAVLSRFRDLSGIFGFEYLRPDFRQTRANVQIQCIFQKLSSLTSKKFEFNYLKMDLIKLLLPFCPSSLDYLQKRPKHGLEMILYS